jgi:hypothetical protein
VQVRTIDCGSLRLSQYPNQTAPREQFVQVVAREARKARLVDAAHRVGMKVIPWTVSDRDTVEALMDIGVDGIITDLPKRRPRHHGRSWIQASQAISPLTPAREEAGRDQASSSSR